MSDYIFSLSIYSMDKKITGKPRLLIGRRIIYERESFVEWMFSRDSSFVADLPERMFEGKRKRS